MKRRYIDIAVNERRLAEDGSLEIEVIDWNNLRKDGYDMRDAGKQMFYNFFEREIFSEDTFQALKVGTLGNSAALAAAVKNTIEQRMDSFDALGLKTVEQVLLQFCGPITTGMQQEMHKVENQGMESEEKEKLLREVNDLKEALLFREKQVNDLEYEKALFQNRYEKERVEKRKAEIAIQRISLELEKTEKELQKRKRRRTLGDRILQLIGIVYWVIWKLDGGNELNHDGQVHQRNEAD